MRGKKLTYNLSVAVVLFLMPLLSLSSQSPFNPAYAGQAEQIVEHLQVFTDRSIYAVEESIYFVADQRVLGLAEDGNWSNMLYVELLSSEGKAVVQEKYRSEGGVVRASLQVPSGTLTGDYLLKCYTRWMRNRGPGTFSYTPLKIINPFRKEISAAFKGGAQRKEPSRVPYREDILICGTSSSHYAAGEEINLKLLLAEQLVRQAVSCCITVVPEGAIDLRGGQYREVASEDSQEPFRVSYLPDMGRGLSISGSVVGPDQLPVPYTTLHFSLLGEHPDYFAAISDKNGKFSLASTSGEGKQEFFVTPDQYEVKDLEVRIDQEFDVRPGPHPAGEFTLSSDERELAGKLALNMQLSKAYRVVEVSQGEVETEGVSKSGQDLPFYGTRVKQLLIDDFVRLPNLEEIFINLVPEVQTFKKKGKTGIRIISENKSIGVYQPLIMIDNISVFDIESMLALSPEKIERIDLINDIYLKGSVPFGGVLAIYSRKGDMAGIDLPGGSYFFDVQGLHQATQEVMDLPEAGKRVPDTRNTIYWNSDVVLEFGKPADIFFRAPTGKGRYVILLRGLSADGEIYSASSEFTVE